METRWHLMPGQTLENTKICDRKTELHIRANEWKKITQKLDRRNLKEEAAARAEEKRKKMKEESQAMVDSWEDSLLVIISVLHVFHPLNLIFSSLLR